MTRAKCDTVEDFWIGREDFVPFRFSVLEISWNFNIFQHGSTLLASNRMSVLSPIVIHSLGTSTTPLEPWVVLEAWCNAGVSSLCSDAFIIIYHHLSSFIIIYHHLSSFIIYLSSFIIIYHHLSSFIIIYHLFIIIYHHLSSFIIYISSFIIIYHDLSLFIIIYHCVALLHWTNNVKYCWTRTREWKRFLTMNCAGRWEV